MTDDQPLLAPVVLATFDYWRSKLRGQLMPARRDLDPSEIPQLLPYLILTDVLQRST